MSLEWVFCAWHLRSIGMNCFSIFVIIHNYFPFGNFMEDYLLPNEKCCLTGSFRLWTDWFSPRWGTAGQTKEELCQSSGTTGGTSFAAGASHSSLSSLASDCHVGTIRACAGAHSAQMAVGHKPNDWPREWWWCLRSGLCACVVAQILLLDESSRGSTRVSA